MSDRDYGCPNCRRSNRDAASFCVRCGSLLVPMDCGQCGIRSEPGDRYCYICGSFLRAQFRPKGPQAPAPLNGRP